MLECSREHTPRSFVLHLLDQLKIFCPYDSAVLFFFDANGKISGSYTVGIPQTMLNTFLDYYLPNKEALPSAYDLYGRMNERSDFNFSQITRWSNFPDSEFKRDYIDVLGLKYSWGFCFFDLYGAYRVTVSIDRKREIPYSETEQARLNLALPILNNMHRNFFYQGTDAKEKIVQTPWKEYNLTAREREISGLLCQGMTVQNIASALYISVATTYKHTANIFKKTGVTSQQELIVKLLNEKRV